jgi:microcystin-dependent protein
MNGILYAITIIQQWQSAGGMFKYDSAFSAAIGGYPKGALLLKADSSGYWQNTVENNTTNPDVSGVGWIDFATSALVSLTGAVQGFAMNSVPAGWLKCNGSAVSRTTYSALFAAIGVTYGAGDGSTTFNLPDMRGEFARGLDDGRGIDSGRVIGSSQIGSLISYDPTVAAPALSGVHPTSSDATIRVDLGLDIPQAGSYPNADVVTGTSSATFTVAQAAGVARPRNVALLYCIKA